MNLIHDNKTGVVMSNINHNSIDESLTKMQLTFANAQNPEILPILQSVGYSKARLQGYLKKVEEINKLGQKQKLEYGEQYAKTEEFNQKRAEIDKIYKKDLALARIIFKDEVQAIATLELNGHRKKAYGSWHKQIENFYAQLLANRNFLTKMQKVGVNSTKINQINNELKAVETIKEQQKKEMGEAQKATEERDNAFDELYPQYRELIDFAKVLLADEQMLESIGVVVER